MSPSAGIRQSTCWTGTAWSRTASANSGRPTFTTDTSSGSTTSGGPDVAAISSVAAIRRPFEQLVLGIVQSLPFRRTVSGSRADFWHCAIMPSTVEGRHRRCRPGIDDRLGIEYRIEVAVGQSPGLSGLRSWTSSSIAPVISLPAIPRRLASRTVLPTTT